MEQHQMADLTQTAANVVPVSGYTSVEGTAGATITAGMPVYSDAADSDKLKPADANASQESAAAVGIALHGASDGQPLIYQTAGSLDLGATLTVGQIYVASITAGKIAPESDLGSGHYVTVLGVASAADQLDMDLRASNVTKA